MEIQVLSLDEEKGEMVNEILWVWQHFGIGSGAEVRQDPVQVLFVLVMLYLSTPTSAVIGRLG